MKLPLRVDFERRRIVDKDGRTILVLGPDGTDADLLRVVTLLNKDPDAAYVVARFYRGTQL